MFLLLCVATALAAHGIVEIDEKSFGKLVGTGHLGVLIAFVEYSWKVPEFYEQVGDAFQDDASILVAKVDVSGVSDDRADLSPSTPTLRFYPANGGAFAEYAGDVEDAPAVIDFVRAQVSPQMQRLVTLAKAFTAATAEAQNTMQKEAESLVAALEAGYARVGKVYVAMMSRIRDRGAAFVATEQARLGKLIAAGSSVAEDKVQDFKQRLSILRNFVTTSERTEL